MQKRMDLKEKKPGDKSMFTDKEFEFLQKTFLENNPELANDQEAIEEKIDDFREDINNLLGEKPVGFEEGVLILIQALNFLARFSGTLEFVTPDLEEKTEEITFLPPPIESKHNAVFIADKESSPFYQSVVKVFEICASTKSDVLRYKFYRHANELLRDIMQGLVCGVVAFQLDANSSIESYLRHDLKYISGFNHKSAQEYVLPICLDFMPPHRFFEIVDIMAKLQNGNYQPVGHVDDFSLKDALPHLLAHMYVPIRQTKVMIIDDILREMFGMKIILDAWPNLECSVVIQNRAKMPTVPNDIDILLLDEGMKITGTQIAAYLRNSLSFNGLIVSTTSGEKPSYAQRHFGVKGTIVKDYNTAREFVSFVNSLLQIIDN